MKGLFFVWLLAHTMCSLSRLVSALECELCSSTESEGPANMQRKADISTKSQKKGHLTVLTEATMWAICRNAPSSKSTHFLIKHQLKIPSVSGRQLIKGNFLLCEKSWGILERGSIPPFEMICLIFFLSLFLVLLRRQRTGYLSQDTMNKNSVCALHQGNNALRMGCSLRCSCTLSMCFFQEHPTLRPFITKTKTLLFQKHTDQLAGSPIKIMH